MFENEFHELKWEEDVRAAEIDEIPCRTRSAELVRSNTKHDEPVKNPSTFGICET